MKLIRFHQILRETEIVDPLAGEYAASIGTEVWLEQAAGWRQKARIDPTRAGRTIEVGIDLRIVEGTGLLGPGFIGFEIRVALLHERMVLEARFDRLLEREEASLHWQGSLVVTGLCQAVPQLDRAEHNERQADASHQLEPKRCHDHSSSSRVSNCDSIIYLFGSDGPVPAERRSNLC